MGPPALQPRPGFDWSRVKWNPRQPPESCSYCDAFIPEDDMPLVLFRARKWGQRKSCDAAAFCLACQKTWWGLETFPEEH